MFQKKNSNFPKKNNSLSYYFSKKHYLSICGVVVKKNDKKYIFHKKKCKKKFQFSKKRLFIYLWGSQKWQKPLFPKKIF